MTLLDLVRGVHIAAGSLALVVMWVPLLSPKGGGLHRRAGRIYVIAMGVVTVAAVAACVQRLFFDPDSRHHVFATYLLFVAVLAAAQCSAGVRVLRAKSRTAAHRQPWDVGIALLLTLSGFAVLVWGIHLRIPLFIGFAPVGIVIGLLQLAYWLRAPRGRMHWWFEHMFQMFGASISTVSAFVVNNSRHLGLPGDSLVVWLAPGVVGLLTYLLCRRHYRRRFQGPAAAASQAA
jgi:uncharacterized membrane protein